MTLFVAASLLTAVLKPRPEPVLWLHPNGVITVDGKKAETRLANGARAVRLDQGIAYDFNGVRSGILFGDMPNFQIVDALTVSAWIYPRSFVNDGPGAQILFRGDDRNGHDPYFLTIHGNGTINFAVQNEFDQGRHATADLPLNTWSHILGSFDSETGRLNLFRNGELLAFTTTSIAPFARLEPNWAPGLSVGNVQNDAGPHNQPFNGMLFDLRVYRTALTPDDLGPFGHSPRIPPK